MTNIVQMSKGGTKFYPQTHVQAVLGLPDFSSFQKASDVQTAVTNAISPLQTQVTNSAVGTNLLLKTYEPLSMTGNNMLNQVMPIYSLIRSLEKGTTVTLSFDAVSTASANFVVQSSGVGGGTWMNLINDNVGTTKKHYVATATLDGFVKRAILMRLDNVPSTTTITVSNMKLELGSVATDWCLNPLEIATDGSVQTAIANALGKVATINVISQADYDKLADKSGVYFIKG